MNNLLSNIIIVANNIRKGEISVKYNKESQTVISWANMVETGKKKIENVPTLFGLRKVVAELLEDRAKTKVAVQKEEYIEELEKEVTE